MALEEYGNNESVTIEEILSVTDRNAEKPIPDVYKEVDRFGAGGAWDRLVKKLEDWSLLLYRIQRFSSYYTADY